MAKAAIQSGSAKQRQAALGNVCIMISPREHISTHALRSATGGCQTGWATMHHDINAIVVSKLQK
eukprot:16344121-Heterocapsa_arctica.AAC.1